MREWRLTEDNRMKAEIFDYLMAHAERVSGEHLLH